MNENINITNETNETNENQNTSLYTMDYCLAQIAKIQSETVYLNDVFNELSKVQSGGPGDVGAAERAKALGDVVKCRETTNQKLLDFYIKMYDNLRTSTVNVATETQKELTRIGSIIADYCCEDDACGALTRIAEMIKELAEKAMKI